MMNTSNPAMPRKPYEGLIFDCDGTLTDSMPLHFLAWRAALSPFGLLLSEDRFYAMAGIPSDKIIQLLSAEQQIHVDYREAAKQKEQAFLDRIHLLEPIAPVIEVVKHFRKRVPMAVASGGFRHIILRQLQHIGCEELFDSIVAAEDTQRHKPNPDVFLEAAKRLNVAPHNCLVYEDADLGVEAAAAAGMDVIDVRQFYQPKRFGDPQATC